MTLFTNINMKIIALNKRVDATNISQLMIFPRLVGENIDFHEKLLAMHPLTGGTKRSDIYETLNFVVFEFGGFKKCSCIVTEGAKAIVGTKIVSLDCQIKRNKLRCIA